MRSAAGAPFLSPAAPRRREWFSAHGLLCRNDAETVKEILRRLWARPGDGRCIGAFNAAGAAGMPPQDESFRHLPK